MGPPNRRLHEEGHQAASCEARRQKEHWAIVLPVASRIHGTTFCAMKPPRLPTELIAASPAAAEAPVRNFDGRLHNTGCGQKIPAAATHRNANRNVLLGV